MQDRESIESTITQIVQDVTLKQPGLTADQKNRLRELKQRKVSAVNQLLRWAIMEDADLEQLDIAVRHYTELSEHDHTYDKNETHYRRQRILLFRENFYDDLYAILNNFYQEEMQIRGRESKL